MKLPVALFFVISFFLFTGCKDTSNEYVIDLGAVTPSPTEALPEFSPPDVGVSVPEGEWALKLVNFENLLAQDFTVELGSVDGKKVDARIAEVTKKLCSDAAADGVNIYVQSSYRTVEKQTSLFENKVNSIMSPDKTREEAEAVAAMTVARPLTSEHHLGLAIDFLSSEFPEMEEPFENTAAFTWMTENAWKYGFILRYPKGFTEITGVNYEPWHWRFVGVKAAYEIREAGTCLETYLQNGK